MIRQINITNTENLSQLDNLAFKSLNELLKHLISPPRRPGRKY